MKEIEASSSGLEESAILAIPSNDKPAQKVLLKRTTNAKKKEKPLPTFTVGELLPWKGAWFRLVAIQGDILYLKPEVEITNK